MGNFPDVLSYFLSKDMRVKGDPMSIRFKERVSFSPFWVTRCRQVPLHMKDEADALLADLEQKGRLECDKTTENLFRSHFVPPRSCGCRGGSTARPSRCAAGATFAACPTFRPPARSGCMGGRRPGAASRSCPRERLAPPFPARRATWAVGWPRLRPRWMSTTWREGLPLSAVRGRQR